MVNLKKYMTFVSTTACVTAVGINAALGLRSGSHNRTTTLGEHFEHLQDPVQWQCECGVVNHVNMMNIKDDTEPRCRDCGKKKNRYYS